MGLIVRTAGIGRGREELQNDLDYLMHLWQSIQQAARDNPAPTLVYEDSDAVVRILRDYLRNDIGEVLIDDENFYNRAQQFMQRLMLGEDDRVRLYSEPDPLFVRYQVESQIETAYSRTVSLPSGGEMVFDNTEALLSIDINSARNTGGSDIEETALHTNLEAAVEIPRQLRLRDIGGLVVIDFIDMVKNSNQRKVEDKLREHIRIDRARVQIGRISRFGLLEMSRQRLRPSLSDAHLESCPKCRGTGHLRTVVSQVNAILRLIEEESFKEATARVLVRLPVDVCSVLINDKKDALKEIEKHTGTAVMIFPSKNLDHPDYQIRRIRDSGEDGTSEAEQEFHSSTPLASSDEAFFRHSQPQKNYKKNTDSQPAVKFNDISMPTTAATATTAATPGNSNGKEQEASSQAGGGIRKGLFSLFGLLSDKSEQDSPEPGTDTAAVQGQRRRNTRNARDDESRGGRRGNRGSRSRRGNNRRRSAANNDYSGKSRSANNPRKADDSAPPEARQRNEQRRQYGYRNNNYSSSGGNFRRRGGSGSGSSSTGNRSNRYATDPDDSSDVPDDIGNRR